MHPGDLIPSGRINRPLGPTGVFETPIYCRRDDWAFLPPNALGGLPCLAVPRDMQIDPRELAMAMEAAMPPPDLRIEMNPRLGMVAVPTWFWVEGYDGGDLRQVQTNLVAHEECHLRASHTADGTAVLEPDGRPRLERICEVRTTTFTVEVRLWPNHYAWDFGDQHTQHVACSSTTECNKALGQIYTDPLHASSVQHPYVWTSLGRSGQNVQHDAYTVGLGITFSAAFRVGVNANGLGGWQTLPDRQLTWSASHQVQEAQAVLSRP
jgi:hypothetical protein